jgi:arsenate reductase
MAEGIVNHELGDTFEAYSAGLNPGIVNPHAITVMREIGIDISKHRSKHVNEYTPMPFDLVVTVCDNAKENCPLFPGATKVIHVGFDDPADAAGTEEEILDVFRRVRDEIREQIPRFLETTFLD